MPKRMLIVTYHHPPDGSVGGLRWAALAKYLVRSGWTVEMITGTRAVSLGVVNGVRVHVVPRFPTTNDGYRALARLVRGRPRPGAAVPESAAPERPRGFWRTLRWEAASLLSFPDESRGWTLRAAWHTRRIVKRLRPDVVVSSGPPHSAHVACALGLLGLDVPLVLDFRDPWALRNDGWRHHPVYGTDTARFLIRHLEAWVVRRARAIIGNTRELAGLTHARYPDATVEWLRNGVDLEDLPARTGAPFPGLAVCHVGTLYGNRNLGPALTAFRTFLDRHPDAEAAGSRLRIAGHMSGGRREALLRQVERAGLAGRVELLGMLPRAAAVDVVRRSTVALVLAQDQALGVPAKLYESLAAARATVVLAEPGTATAREALDLGADVCGAEDADGIARAFARVWTDRDRIPRPAVEPFSYSRLAERLEELLGGGAASEGRAAEEPVAAGAIR